MFEKILEHFYGPLDNYRAELGNYEDLLRVEKELEKKKFLRKFTNLESELKTAKLKSGFFPNKSLEEQLRDETFDEFKDRYGLKGKYFDELKVKNLYSDYKRRKKLVKI